MNKFLKMAALATSLIAGSAIAAPIANGPVDADAFVTFKGYDLAWASPCSTGVNGTPSCSPIDLSVQAVFGWKIMTSSLFQSLGYDYNVFAVNYSSINTQEYNGKNYAKASKWFNAFYSHIDVSDAEGGYWSFADVNDINGAFESVVYRISQSNSVPNPAPITLLGVGLIALVMRRKSK